jgi:L-threonylcarbamoyladenylate synthase
VIEDVAAALERGEPVILPTDTVYGLCAIARSEEAVRRLYTLKGRGAAQPTALVAADAAALLDVIPELAGRPLLHGPYTLVFPNPERRVPWLTGGRPETIGVRLPDLPDDAAAVLRRVGAVAATSANLPGGPDPRNLGDVPCEIREGCAAEIDAGDLPGTPSTVIDLTGDKPAVIREGAVPAQDALRRLAKP